MQIYQNVSKISFFVMFFESIYPLYLQGMTIGRGHQPMNNHWALEKGFRI